MTKIVGFNPQQSLLDFETEHQTFSFSANREIRFNPQQSLLDFETLGRRVSRFCLLPMFQSTAISIRF